MPQDLSIHLDKLSTEEFHAIIPSEYEIQKLSYRQLLQQLIKNTLQYQPDYDMMSRGLKHALRSWMTINEDDRLFSLLENDDKVRSNLWKVIGLSFTMDNPTSLPSLEEFKLNKGGETDHPYFVKLAEHLEKIVQMKGDTDEYLNFFDKIIQDHQFVDKYKEELSLITWIFRGPLTSLPEKAEPLLGRMTTYYENLNLEYHHHVTKFGYANTLMMSGKFEEAERLYEKVVEYAESHDFDFAKNAKNNRGLIFLATKKLEEAIELYSELLEDEPDHPTYLNNLADAYSKLGRMEEAWKYAKRFLTKSDFPFIGSYEFIQPILFDLGLDEEANRLMSRVENINEETDIEMNEAFLLLMKARQARYDLNLGSAVKYANQAIEMGLQWKNLQLLIPLLVEHINIHLDLYEMKSTSNNRQRLFNAIDAMIQFSDEQGLASGSIEALRLRAKVNMKFDNIENARKDLYNATKLAEQFDYQNLYKETYVELEEIKEKDHVSDEESQSIFTSIKSKLRDLMGMGGATQEYQKQEYTTHGTFIMSTAGMPIYSNYLTDKLKTDSGLISGLISAVSSMLNEATQSQGYLQSIKRDDFSLLFEPVHDYLVVSVVSSDSFEARQRLQSFSLETRELLEKYGIESMAGEIPREFDKELDDAINNTLVPELDIL